MSGAHSGSTKNIDCLLQSGLRGAGYTQHIKTRSPGFSDLPTALQFDSHSVQRTLQDDQRAII